jgi:hypothetical protein
MDKNIYKVYWTNPHNRESYGEYFDTLKEALNQCEQLRVSGRTFVTMVSENPNSVGQPGVAEVGPNYDWKKRRI